MPPEGRQNFSVGRGKSKKKTLLDTQTEIIKSLQNMLEEQSAKTAGLEKDQNNGKVTVGSTSFGRTYRESGPENISKLFSGVNFTRFGSSYS